MEFSKEKTPTQSKIFSKRYFLVLFFLLFLVVIFFPAHNVAAGTGVLEMNTTAEIKQGMQQAEALNKDEACSIFALPRCFILVMFKFAGFLLTLSATIFTWIINADNIKYIISDNTAIYSSWTFVRDILNMAFIMVLLFSAFCTIFQIEPYNYKKLLWKIVLMALLVNFSFPIARIIIDASNILMYTLLKSTLFGTGEAAKSITTITNGSGLGSLIGGSTKDISNTMLLANTVMIFMLAITFLAIGILLLIRIIALAILIIFSPIAFVGSIMPGVSSYASQWWDNLFKYSFFGPIMIFGVSIAVKLMNDTTNMDQIKNLAKAAGKTAADSTFLGQIGIVAIPIVLLWMVIGVAQKSSIAGAGAVMGAAQGAMKWAGKAPGKAAWWGIKKTGVPGGVQQKWAQFKKTGRLGSDATEKRAAWVAEKTPYSVKGAINEHARKKANEKRDEWKKTGAPSKKELGELLKGSDNIKARAAALELAETTGFDGNYTDYEHTINKVLGEDASAIETLNEKTKKKGRDLILAYKINQEKDKDGNPNIATLQEELAKMDNADFGSINFENLIANTTNRGHDRGGSTAVQEFFKHATNDRKTQISRRMSPKNEEYLENNQLFTAKGKEDSKAGSPEWANKEFEKLTKKPEQGSENTKKV